MNFFEFILFGVCLDPYICVFSFAKFDIFYIIPIFFQPHSLLFFWDSNDINVGSFLIVHGSLRVCSFFFLIYFLSSSEWVNFIYLFSHLLILFADIVILLLSLSSKFKILDIIFSVRKFPFHSFSYLIFIFWDFLHFHLFQENFLLLIKVFFLLWLLWILCQVIPTSDSSLCRH